MTKKLVIDRSEWFIADSDAAAVTDLVRDALTNRRTVELELFDADGRAVTVFLNGAAVTAVALDLDRGPRPSEMS
ncbi:hypothetical protein [Actinoplanes siamensis]|uniref:Uncharacterized protein n=1 Tax=Actinoplanes siamensis TaxID=1223317 RepID=A0A919TM30_9ACTN|nr:hypothetical protein [Actinoplanes siamensis]GIF06848.1 hypothetical protein Asi03nite_43860 [Actinoplanes siamensis]